MTQNKKNNISHVVKYIINLSSFITLLFLSTTASAVIPQDGKSYFTKHNFMFEKGRHVTTNYWRGDMVPVNSKVKVIAIGGKKMTLEYKGQIIKVLNVPKHTKKTIEEIADNMLSATPVKIPGKYAKSIKFGEMRLGMTKNEVLMTRGYPPAHKTFSTESDRWIYWSSKFVQMTLIFENNRLTQGRGLR